ncbi:hypothetical protein [Thalassoglobus sp.]|uniref:hypothetical protein n=1 Tax=Thalassoglobus sp. TaxID=2795869 RepID=UPI003AA873A0
MRKCNDYGAFKSLDFPEGVKEPYEADEHQDTIFCDMGIAEMERLTSLIDLSRSLPAVRGDGAMLGNT